MTPSSPYRPGEPTEVWLVEDNPRYRDAIAALLALEPEARLLVFGACEEALEALEQGHVPDVVLMDIGLPGLSGIEGTRRVKAVTPATHVIVLTVHEDDDVIFEALCAGASGYLLKSATSEEILEALAEVRTGGAPMTPRVARRVLDLFTRLTAPQGDYGLRAREQEILELLVEGYTKRQIAERLHLGFSTVDFHMRNIYAKLQVHSRSDAVAKALRERLV